MNLDKATADSLLNAGSGGGSNYANPHAPTNINGNTYTYDNNGNLLTTNTLTNTWNYRNELTTTTNSNQTTTYTYDHTGQRVSKTTGTTTTLYPSPLYQTQAGTITKHLYLNDKLIGTIKAATPAPQFFYNHLDHLGSTNATTDEDGYLNSVYSYHPFGDTRIEQTYGNTSEDIQYVGTRHDAETDLNYMGARYYRGTQGQFLSQDRANIDLGSQSWESQYGRPLELFLRDPQQLNTYGYARNNPIVNKDPGGDIIPLVLGLAYAGLSIYDAYSTGLTLTDPNVGFGGKALALGLFASPLGEMKAGAKVVESVADRLAKVRSLGVEGEVAAGILKNTEKIPDLIQGGGKQRIPDGLSHENRLIQEVKNTSYQSNTRQLRAFTEYSKQNGYSFELYVRPTTRLSLPLQNSIDDIGGQVKRDLPDKKK